ncbi:MAG TPA: TrkH family potassium uptake protein [Alphaproteobacteria bacterium]|nr:TrkH family potassium uptake protein [Alphaproteobacteria bacterium]
MTAGDRAIALGAPARRRRAAAIDFRPILYVIGYMLLALAASMILPALVDAGAHHPDWKGFLASAAITAFVGGALVVTNQVERPRIGLREGFLLTTLSWTAMCAFGALPFLFSDLNLRYADAYFETMSGLTTTGSTVIVGLDKAPPGILLWRGLLHGIGGLGIVAMAVIMLPFLRIGGMQLFRTESSDRSEKVLPRPAEIAKAIGVVYVTLIALCTAALWASGMNLLEASTHAMAAIATGGFSTSDDSVAHFKSPLIDWILIVFMAAGALPMLWFFRVARGEYGELWRDSQVRNFLIMLSTICLGVTFYRWSTSDAPFWEVLRLATFNVVSVTTTTGFATTDYTQWGGFVNVTFMFITFLGGCSGSTAGAIKMFRLEVMFITMRYYMRRLLQPRGIFPRTYNREPLSEEVMLSVLGFTGMYMATFLVLSGLVALTGLDFVTSISGVAQAMGNVGPGLGPIIGPAGNFSSLSDTAKWLLSLAMLVGRLELFTVYVLLVPRFWRD